MSENSFKNSYVCPECYCADGWTATEDGKPAEFGAHNIASPLLECKHCRNLVPLINILEYNKENSGWFRLE
jgi:hypothetical protein